MNTDLDPAQLLPRARIAADGLIGDAVTAVALCALALISFHGVFGGAEFFVVGLVGGIGAATTIVVTLRQQWPAWFGALVGAVVFLVVGAAVGAHADSIGGLVPSVASLRGVFDGSVHGWYALVTTLPPAGSDGHVMIVPYLCGFFGVALSLLLVRSSRLRLLAGVPPFVVLAAGVLVGGTSPVSLLVEGGVLTAGSVWWASAISGRSRPVLGQSRSRRGLGAGAAMLMAVALVSVVVGPNLPGAGAKPRYVLRDHVHPPFDPNQYPSPLVGFRNFRTAQNENKKKTVLTVTGLPKGTRIRFAVMDSYDGLVWRVANASSQDVFRTSGEAIDQPYHGKRLTAHFTVGQLIDDVWLPLVGAPNDVRFSGTHSAQLKRNLRFSVALDAGAVSSPLHAGDQYSVTFQTPGSGPSVGTPASGAVTTTDADNPYVAKFADKANTIVGDASDPLDAANAIKAWFAKNGYYDDGNTNNVPSPPGHFFARLGLFLGSDHPTGNAEQYAAASALLLRSRGIPARVVLGIDAEKGPQTSTYTGHDVTAWIEVPGPNGIWSAVDPTAPESNKPLPPKVTQSRNTPSTPQVAPPRESRTIDAGNAASAAKTGKHNPPPPPPKRRSNALLTLLVRLLEIAVVPLLAVVLPVSVVLALKRRRRVRRRHAATPAAQISGGWREVTDLLRDLGRPVPRTATRHELAVLMADGAIVRLADRVDAGVFGGEEPTVVDARGVWEGVNDARASLTAGLSRLQRLRCSININSLRTEDKR